MKYYNSIPETAIRAIFTLGKKLTGSFEENRSVIDDILGTGDTASQATKSSWTSNKASRYISELTSLQKTLLEHLKHNPNTTLPGMVAALQKAGYPAANSYTISGATSGLTKKCKKYGLSSVYEATVVDNEWKYRISEDAAPHFP